MDRSSLKIAARTAHTVTLQDVVKRCPVSAELGLTVWIPRKSIIDRILWTRGVRHNAEALQVAMRIVEERIELLALRNP